MFDFGIGLGQGGGRLAKSFKDGMELSTVVMNLAGIDFAHMGLGRYERLVFESGGTGRDPRFGEQLAGERIGEIRDFLNSRKNFRPSRSVLVTVGGGGGAGTGFLFPVLDYLLELGKEIFLIYTLPESREGLPTKPNALETLDRLIKDYIQKERVATLLIDNDFCIQRYGHSEDGDYWGAVNTGIVTGLKRFHVLTQLEKYSDFIDVSAGYKALDANDLRRMLFATNGYVDLRRMVFSERLTEDGGLMRAIRESSLVFGSLDIRTAKQYVISIGIPMKWKRLKWTAEFIEEIFSAVSKATRHTPSVIRTSYYNARINDLQVHLLLSGMARSKGIDKMIRGTEKDQFRLDARKGVDRLDINSVVRKSRKQ
jgi:cell division GTPase FtsZ